MGIDIRQGYQIECINCGRCLDACRLVMARRQQEGLMRYSFGTDSRGMKALVNAKVILLSTALLTISIILVVAVVQRKEATVKVTLSHTASSRILTNGQQVTFFTLWINNRSATDKIYELTAFDVASAQSLTIKGTPSTISIGAGKNLHLDVAVVADVIDTPRAIQFVLFNDGRKLAAADAEIYKENIK